VTILCLARQTHFLLTDRESRGACRDELLKAQSRAGSSITQLLRLNIQVRLQKNLRRLAKAEEVAALAHLNVPLATSAQAQWQAADAALTTLRIEQEFLILQARQELQRGLWMVQERLHQVWRKRDRARDHLQSVEGRITQISTVHLAVRQVDDQDPNPEYELEEYFSDKQSLQASWRVTFVKSQEIQKWTPPNWNLERSCAATLVPKNSGDQFQARLVEGRSSLKSLFYF